MDITLPEVQTNKHQVKLGQVSLSREELRDIFTFLRDIAPWAFLAWAIKGTAKRWDSSPSTPAI